MKALLYGNCQMSVLANWLKKHMDLVKPSHYSEDVKHDWEQNIFFPVSFKDKSEILSQAIHDCDLLLFHHTNNTEFIQSKTLYDACDKQKACITTFYFDAYYEAKNGLIKLEESVLSNIKKLKHRHLVHKSLYGEDCIDMSGWIEENWEKKFITSEVRHPTHFYYRELSKRISDRFFLSENIGLIPQDIKTHKDTNENFLDLRKLLPQIKK